MTPKQEAEKIELEIKALGFQIDTFRFRKIAVYAINKIQSELQEVEKVAKVNMTEMIRYWEEVKKEL